VALLADPADRHAVTCAIARAFPRFNLKTSSKSPAKTAEAGNQAEEEEEDSSSSAREVVVMFAGPAGEAVQWNTASSEQAALEASQVAARAVSVN